MVKVQNKKRVSSDKVNSIKDAKKEGINPFEVHINRQKHHVLGQKLKNDRGLPGVSRAKALKRRKNTLLQEYNALNKTNKFVDRRIGERNTMMTSEDRQMARFTAVRVKSHNKKSIYNLADEEVLTHRGQTLTEIEKFDDPRSDDSDDDDIGYKNSGKLDDNFVEDAHFGGGILKKSGPDGAKSHKDFIEQLIAESKKRKAEKQKIREQTIELTEKLDTEWKDLLPLVSKSKRTETNEPETRNVDPYDKVMRELKFEARGNPTDRLKSEEEIAKEEKQRLEQLEQDRINRMKGFEEQPKIKHKSADDLDDNFAFDLDDDITIAYDAEGKPLFSLEGTKPEEEINEEKSDESEESNNSESSEEEEDSDDDLADLKNSESSSEDDETKPVQNKPKNKKTNKKEVTDNLKKEKSFTDDILETIPKVQDNKEEETSDEQKEQSSDEEKEKESSDEEEEEEQSTDDTSEDKEIKLVQNKPKHKKTNKREEIGDLKKEKSFTDDNLGTIPKVKEKSKTKMAYKEEENSDEENEQSLDEEKEKESSDEEEAEEESSSDDSSVGIVEKKSISPNIKDKINITQKDGISVFEKDEKIKLKKRKAEDIVATPQKKEKTTTNLQENAINETSTKDTLQENLNDERKLLVTLKELKPEDDILNKKETSQEKLPDNKFIEELLAKEKLREEAAKELPFTFKIPENYEDFQTLFSDKTPEQQSIILERMIKCNNPNIVNMNKQTLGKIFAYVLQYLSDISSEKNCFITLYNLMPQLFDLTQLNKEGVHESMIEVIKEKFHDFNKNPKKYPGIDVLLFLKIVGTLFPTSDFRHQVVTPSIVFINHMLTTVRPKNKYDILYGMFLVILILEYTSLSRRLVPSAINFLSGIFHMAIPKLGVQLIKVTLPFKPISTNLVVVNKYKSKEKDFRMPSDDFFNHETDDSFKVRIIYNAVKMLEEFYENYLSLPSWGEMFSPHLNFIDKLPIENYPKEIQNLVESVSNKLKDAMKNRKMEYLVKAVKKPKALRLYEPNIIKIVEGKNYRVMSKEQAEKSKLLHKYKKEKKGALREIRRDKSFIGRVKLKQRMESDRERKEKVKRIFAEASIQQSELNAMTRKKKK